MEGSGNGNRCKWKQNQHIQKDRRGNRTNDSEKIGTAFRNLGIAKNRYLTLEGGNQTCLESCQTPESHTYFTKTALK